MVRQKTKDTGALFVTIEIALLRISSHSKKIGGITRQLINDRRSLLSKAKELADRLCNDEILEKSFVNQFLAKLKDLQKLILEEDLENNPSYSVLTKSFEEMIKAFEELND